MSNNTSKSQIRSSLKEADMQLAKLEQMKNTGAIDTQTFSRLCAAIHRVKKRTQKGKVKPKAAKRHVEHIVKLAKKVKKGHMSAEDIASLKLTRNLCNKK